MTATSTNSKSFYITDSSRNAREIRRKIVYIFALIVVCVALGIAIAVIASFVVSAAMQILWNSVRG